MKFTFRHFKDDKDAQSPGQRRREQVRRAQKTHRDRKEAYSASLESEVTELRALKARLSQDVALLTGLLAENRIPIPRGVLSAESERGVETGKTVTLVVATQEENKKKNRRRQICVHGMPGDLSSIPLQLVTPPGSGPSSPQHARYMGNIDPEVVGMDFVLTLESPCLQHIDVAPSEDPNITSCASTGHSLTLSACVFHNHPSQPGQRQNSSTPWEIPQASIATLLALSASIPLAESEVTPVQAWDYVRRQEQFAGLEVARWETLKEKLLGVVRCYGFGGVIPRDVFENAVFEAFVVGRVF
ncbi:bZIP 2 domain containing protein [Pyrenophora tritici-repentis]|uniref:Amelogenin multi-domain protein n=1 Tax=Pyrenophora tritici-repentis TaxID=45151 RepID=A0A5M9KP18_9PLEO|nr:bZIP-2 domain-containing protein [Pyrenophora tritici-repentis]KAF7442132.1 bZIP 2 domain containing protein [Pyrenophora tritici-repentis]KAF7579506.1 Amelogenin multi-domain protein [Pyrenophora tritici-repentis]KAG9378410.1 bZIP 2 domain containing protein [Pyrenophora tritici-repentis]KAI0577677.1 bZIP-2 domain-containing protein [Pyrenophora tritici-repentis]